MKIEAPDAGRVRLTVERGRVEAVIPARKNWFVICVLGFWLCGWGFGWISAAGILLGGLVGASEGDTGGPFLLFWFCGWTVGGLAAMAIFLWTLAGEERITLENGVLTVERRIPFWRRRRAFERGLIERMSAVQPAFTGFPFNQQELFAFMTDFRQGSVQFDYGRGSRAFGIGLDRAEADEIVAVLAPRLPQGLGSGA